MTTNPGRLSPSELQQHIAAQLFVHWCQFDAPDEVSSGELAKVAKNCFRQAAAFAAVAVHYPTEGLNS